MLYEWIHAEQCSKSPYNAVPKSPLPHESEATNSCRGVHFRILLRSNSFKRAAFKYGSRGNSLFASRLTLIVPSANSVSPLKIAVANRLIHASQKKKNYSVFIFVTAVVDRAVVQMWRL